jgi:sarcosine oxidase
MRRYPAFRLPGDFIVVMQPEGGFVEAARSIRAHQDLAKSAGAEIRFGERVMAVEPRGDGVRVVTARGAIEADAAIVAAGPWAREILPDLPIRLRPTRQAIIWVDPPKPELLTPDRFPVFMIDSDPAIHYGFPLREGEGFKISKHHHEDESVEPDTYDRTVSAKDEALIRFALERYLPAANGPVRARMTCLYTMTDDGDFVLDHVPGSPQIVLGSPCSGHGFKFSPVIGEILADLALKRQTAHNISRFRLAR